ncbi:MAG: response regulator transcription factor [Saprospiraceae bacterium]|jgi:DNA-binding LytR/AlgR family response regulator|nr:response regulator transcription factor [Saprospiraceae bacterium]
MNVLIIEDEIPAAKQIQKLLGQETIKIDVLDVLDSVEASVRWLNQHPTPDLIIMDIQIADGLSFEIFNQVNITCPVIFTTAFDQYAIQAFRVNAIDYLLKPIDPDHFKAAIARLENNKSFYPLDKELLNVLTNTSKTYKSRFLISIGSNLIPVSSVDIAWFCAEEGITLAYTREGRKHTIEHTLEELERLLDPRQFFRISRGYMVNLLAVKKISPYFSGRLKLELHPAPTAEIFVSRMRVNDFKTWMSE